VVEPAGTEGAFITEEPSKIIMDGNFAKVPLMMGFNDLEGGLASMGKIQLIKLPISECSEDNITGRAQAPKD